MIIMLIAGIVLLTMGAVAVTLIDANNNEHWRAVARDRRNAAVHPWRRTVS